MATNNVINQIGKVPIFSAYSAADQTNVTGDGTSYIVQFPNVFYDTRSSFNPATGIFTAPLTGRYRFNICIFLKGLTVAMTANYCLFNSNYIFYQNTSLTRANSTNWCYAKSIVAELNATDQVGVTIYIGGGTKVASLAGSTGTSVIAPLFSGHMITGV